MAKNKKKMNKKNKTMFAFILNALDNTVIKARYSIQLIENQCFGNG